MSRKIERYGWKPDHPDQRDLKFSTPTKLLKALPPSIDLRPFMPPVVDQGDLGSCTANAACSMAHYVAMKENDKPLITPSRLFEYYNTRKLEGTVSYDSGASIRDSIKSMVQYGFVDESVWPYDIAKYKKKPPAALYKSAAKHLIKQYKRIPQNLAQLKAVLSQNLVIDFGFSVYASFETEAVSKTGIISLPKAHEELLGGHATLLVGYQDEHQWFIGRNSWGTKWGDKGYFYMPYAYVLNLNLASDFWTITSVP